MSTDVVEQNGVQVTRFYRAGIGVSFQMSAGYPGYVTLTAAEFASVADAIAAAAAAGIALESHRRQSEAVSHYEPNGA